MNKKANVAPVFKKGEKYDASNYRPVSLTLIINDRILRVSKFCGEDKYLPSINFYCRKSLFKIVFGRTLLFVNRFSKFLLHNFGQLGANSAKKLLYPQ